MVFLKNDSFLLFLKDLKKIVVIGLNVNFVRNFLGDYLYFVYIVIFEMFFIKEDRGVGNEEEFVKNVINMKFIFEVIKDKVLSNIEVVYVKGCDVNLQDKLGFEEVKKVVEGVDVVILVVGDKVGLRFDCIFGELRDRVFLRFFGV